MKEHSNTFLLRIFIISILTICTFMPSLTLAGNTKEESIEAEILFEKKKIEHKGFFAGVGPMLGFEFSILKRVTGGIAPQFGYRFNDIFALYLEPSLFYSRKNDVNYFIVPILPIFKATFDTNFFASIGGGYTYMWADSGKKLGSSISTRARSYNGWSIIGGVGYDIWWKENICLSPQINLEYVRIASSNLIMPMARVNINWLF